MGGRGCGKQEWDELRKEEERMSMLMVGEEEGGGGVGDGRRGGGGRGLGRRLEDLVKGGEGGGWDYLEYP